MTIDPGVFIAGLILWAVIPVTLALMLREQNRMREKEHRACILHLMDVVSKSVVADAFREAARRWDSVEEKPNLERLGREEYQLGGPSMPAIWLRLEADKIDPTKRKS